MNGNDLWTQIQDWPMRVISRQGAPDQRAPAGLCNDCPHLPASRNIGSGAQTTMSLRQEKATCGRNKPQAGAIKVGIRAAHAVPLYAGDRPLFAERLVVQ